MSYRTIALTFTNGSLLTWTWTNGTTSSGTTPVVSSTSVAPGGLTTMTAEGSGGEGPSGTFTFTAGSLTYSFSYVHPVGPHASSVTWTAPAGFEVLTNSDNLNQHSASASYTLKAQG